MCDEEEKARMTRINYSHNKSKINLVSKIKECETTQSKLGAPTKEKGSKLN